MIKSLIEDAKIGQGIPNGWHVIHGGNGAVLAYCDTKAEAEAYREAVNDLPRLLRAVASTVGYGATLEQAGVALADAVTGAAEALSKVGAKWEQCRGLVTAWRTVADDLRPHDVAAAAAYDRCAAMLDDLLQS